MKPNTFPGCPSFDSFDKLSYQSSATEPDGRGKARVEIKSKTAILILSLGSYS
jgi:hypothetical protein